MAATLSTAPGSSPLKRGAKSKTSIRSSRLQTPSGWVPEVPHKFLAEFQDAPKATNTGPQTASTGAGKEPFPFSHKRHAVMKIECSYCHEASQTGGKVGLPPVSQCMKCHVAVAKDNEQIKKLAALAADTHIVPEKPVYKLPDFVTFSHARHETVGTGCAACHGDVWQSDVVELHLPMRMKACVDCHKANQAPATCTTCHEAFQQ